MKERKRRDSRGSPGSSAGDTATSGQSRFLEGGKEITGTVAALRLDAVLALGFNLSRSRAVLLVKGSVEVNQRPVKILPTGWIKATWSLFRVADISSCSR